MSEATPAAAVDDTDRLLAFGSGFVGLGLVAISMFLPVWDEGSVSAFTSIAENTLLQSGSGWITLIFAGLSAISLIRGLRDPRRVWWPLIWGRAREAKCRTRPSGGGSRATCGSRSGGSSRVVWASAAPV